MSSKLIGIDFGLAKIGLSISDPSKIISIPLKVVRYETKNQLLRKLNEIAIENDVNTFVIGYPLNMNNEKKCECCCCCSCCCDCECHKE